VAEHPNVARIRDTYAAFAKGDMAALNDMFAEDLLWHESSARSWSPPGSARPPSTP
jgi:ketosteroid isomerase-like protein